MKNGIDVSYAQGGIEWAHVKQSGDVDFAYSRVCFGDIPADDDGLIFISNHDGAKTYGIPFGCYFFYLSYRDPVAQAKYFLTRASGRYGQLMPMIDVEELSFVNKNGIRLDDGDVDARIERLSTCIKTIENALGPVLLYTNRNTWRTYMDGTDGFAGHKLWVASFGVPPGQPVMVDGWKSWAVHQYTSGGLISGINAFVDRDVLCGDDLSLITR